MRFGWTARAAIACIGIVVLPLPAAHASPDPQAPVAGTGGSEATPAAQPPQIAVDHYLRGRKWYLAGRYRDALIELKAALEYDHDSADLLYNIARVYENLGELDESIEYYQRYMTHLSVGANDERDRTDKTIRRLQGAKRELALRAAQQGPEQPPTKSIGRADFAFWLTASGGVALLAAGGVTGWFALKKSDQVAAFVAGPDGPLSKRDKLADQAKRIALVSDGLLIGGAVALTGAALLYFLRDGESETPQQTVSFGLGFDGKRTELSLHGAF